MTAWLLTVLCLLSLTVASVAFLLATIANRRWVRARAALQQSRPEAGKADAGPADALASAEAGLAALRHEVGRLSGRLGQVEHEVGTGLRHVAIVRYDAFADVGGRLSYSVAILDDSASGLVITSLSGKADVRTYVKAISAGRSEGTLTPDEQQAIAAARAGASDAEQQVMRSSK